MKTSNNKQILIYVVIGAIALLIVKELFFKGEENPGIQRSNGTIEATSIDIATKLPGRIETILVNDGDFVHKGDLLAVMQLDSLEAQLEEAKAHYRQSLNNEASILAQVTARKSEKLAAEASVRQRESEYHAAKLKLERLKKLRNDGGISKQDYDDQEAVTKSLEAAIATAEAQVLAAQAAIEAAEAQAIGARSQIEAAEATIDRIQADIKDSNLVAPRDGRIQYRIAETGEVLGSGGKVLNLLDLSDVYMTFFIPEQSAGRVKIGSEVRLKLDPAPELVIPATITFISNKAQFTPKSVETRDERQKLMFRARAQIAPELLEEYIDYVKTGVRGEAYFLTERDAQWPPHLAIEFPTRKELEAR